MIVILGAGHEINILQICSTKSTKAKTPKAKAQSKAYNPFDDNEVPTPVSVDELMARRPGKGADNPFVEADATEDGNTPNEHEPRLDLPQLQTGLPVYYSHTKLHCTCCCTSVQFVLFTCSLIRCKQQTANLASRYRTHALSNRSYDFVLEGLLGQYSLVLHLQRFTAAAAKSLLLLMQAWRSISSKSWPTPSSSVLVASEAMLSMCK